MEIEIREMLPTENDPTQTTPGRSMKLTFLGVSKAIKSVMPLGVAGSSGWVPITLTNARRLEDFIGKGQVISGGVQLGPDWIQGATTSGADLHFLNAGGRCFVSASGFDMSVPTGIWGYWKQHGRVQPRPPAPKDVATLKHRLNEQSKKYGGIALFAKQWTYNAYKYTAGDLRTEQAQILGRGVPSPGDALRLAEIEQSLESLEKMMQLMRADNW